MRIDIYAAHWGNNDLPPEVFIDKVLTAGFDGIEMSLPLDAALREEWTQRIAKAGLKL
ncbi:MAG: sugar phosphate isomerase/epimerase, partial [Janthinobacterium lividum]|nr:sugar phosphate isomerase/epimerase [Janthinobacterium lividum]